MTSTNKETVEQILEKHHADIRLWHSGSWDFNGDTPDDIAKKALEAHYAAKYEAAMQEARIEELKYLDEEMNKLASTSTLEEYRGIRADRLAQLKTNPTNYEYKGER